MNEAIERMLNARTFAVAGASTNPEKYGYKCYVDLKRFGKTVYPINPRATTIDGDPCYPTVAALPEIPEVIVAVIPPALTEKLVDDLAVAGVRNLWIQPGAESEAAVAKAKAAGITVVSGGPCILVGLRTHAAQKAA
ncbi:MAG: CoA-binding protein [Cytophagales bacterium]|nr:CoA-binding protein [Armatimonadota bacterium]